LNGFAVPLSLTACRLSLTALSQADRNDKGRDITSRPSHPADLADYGLVVVVVFVVVFSVSFFAESLFVESIFIDVSIADGAGASVVVSVVEVSVLVVQAAITSTAATRARRFITVSFWA
jgi:hypothetical protein